ncbi:MAG: NADP-dependent isocitrate dehydrogenase [Clostridiales bacterium]|jgi:isocitrate dehydrogenase|nr:NADP-dependent isocitrate dehydrogenase [Clostridiales bacterium]
MKKIAMKNPVVEMDGDEMTRILWTQIKEILIEPFVGLNTEYYDLGLKHRDETDDAVTAAAAEAIKRHKVGIKCATITPNAERVKEYGLKKMWKSPNGTIRAILDGTVFREPILADGIKPIVSGWKEPIIIARHAYGDIYRAVEFKVKKGEDVSLKIGGSAEEIMTFQGDGVLSVAHNIDGSIENFAENCFEYALEKKKDLWFGTKDTISKVYDGRFKDIFNDMFEKKYKEKFERAGIVYFYGLIDDVVARVMRSGGGFIWACKNYDGDVMSDMVSTVFGSLAMMTSVLVSENGFEYEAAHGTVTRHYYKYLKGEKTSTNPVATIFAWTGGLKKRGELDGNAELAGFAENLEKTTLKTIENGTMTNDLLPLFKREGIEAKGVSGEEFLRTVASGLTV